MASAIIHLAVAKKVEEILNKDMNLNYYYLGSIAPDAAQCLKKKRSVTHFTESDDIDIPNDKVFLSQYKQYLNNPFELGYYVHLLTDILWFKEFLPNYVDKFKIVDKNGEQINYDVDKVSTLIYNDYTNLNIQIIDYYNLDYSIFYKEYPYPDSHIKELPIEYFDSLIMKMGVICANTSKYTYLFDVENVVHFIDYAAIYVVDNLKNNKII